LKKGRQERSLKRLPSPKIFTKKLSY